MTSFRFFAVLFLCLSVLGCGKAGTHSLFLRYQSVKEFPSLRQKVRSALGVSPFKDERPDAFYIGIHTPLLDSQSHSCLPPGEKAT